MMIALLALKVSGAFSKNEERRWDEGGTRT
jgi:hypothetical protein